MKTKKNRAQFLIYPKFQLTLIGAQFVVLIAMLTPVVLTLYRSFRSLEKSAIDAQLPKTHSIYQFLTLQKEMIFHSLFWPLLIGTIIIILITVWLSDRLAGPIVRLKNEFELMEKNGKLKEVQFRKGDFFSDLPQVINKALKKFID